MTELFNYIGKLQPPSFVWLNKTIKECLFKEVQNLFICLALQNGHAMFI